MIKTALNGIEEVNPPGKKRQLQQKVSMQRILFLLVSTIKKKRRPFYLVHWHGSSRDTNDRVTS